MTNTPLLPDAGWAPDGALILTNRSAVERLRRKRMSISTAETLEQCPASFVRSLLPQSADPFGAREIGIECHEVLEVFYRLPADDRTESALRAQVEQRAEIVWDPERVTRRIHRDGLYCDELTDDLGYDTTGRMKRDKTRWIEQVYASVLGVFLLENPRETVVEATEQKILSTVGDGVPITVTVDRILRLPDGRVRVDDWKFASESKLNPRDDRRDGYADQGRTYARVIEQETGNDVAEMRLIFPGMVGKSVNKDTGAAHRLVSLGEEETNRSIEFLTSSWDTMHQLVDEGRFPAKPSTLCGWCPLVNSCPSAVVFGKKAAKNVEALWSADDLGIPRLDASPTILNAPAHGVSEASMATLSEGPRMETITLTAQVRQNGEIMSMPAPNVTPLRRPVREAAPYVEYLDPIHPGDSTEINVASYAVQAAFSFTGMAFKHLTRTGHEASSQTVGALAETFAMIVADVQFEFVNSTRLHHGINPRLRGLLFDVLEGSPFPIGESVANVEAWIQRAKTIVWASAKIALNLNEQQDAIRQSTAYQSLVSS